MSVLSANERIEQIRALLAKHDEQVKPKINKRQRLLILCVACGLALIGAGVVAAQSLIQHRANALNNSWEARLFAAAEGRAQLMTTWLDGYTRNGQAFIDSAAMRRTLFGLGAERPGSAASATRALDEFAATLGLDAAALVRLDRAGVVEPLTEAPVNPRLTDILRDYGSAELQQPLVTPIWPVEDGLRLDIVLPTGRRQAERPLLLVMSVPVEALLQDVFLDANQTLESSFRRLVQWRDVTLDVIKLERSGLLLEQPDLTLDARPRSVINYRRVQVSGWEPARIVGVPVGDSDFTLIEGIAESQLEAELAAYSRIVYVGTGLFILTVLGGLVAVNLHQRGAHYEEIADEYRDLASEAHQQRVLLESITSGVREIISMKGLDGCYNYVNPAFRAAADLPENRVIGRKDQDLFPASTAAFLTAMDEEALLTGRAVIEEQLVELRPEATCYVTGSKSPLRDERGHIVGVVTLLQDVTAVVEQRQKREHTNQQTVMTLVRAIELSDPYLVGHTKRVQHYALQIGETLNLKQRDLATIDLAASLSQLGKIFIPQHILRKPGRHTPEESRIMRTHIDRAVDVIRDIDFDLPVAEVVAQIYERLDGSGYPNGLSGEEVGLSARVLGAVDVFCARTEPRSYRNQISQEKALFYLAQHPSRYDIRVVNALAELVDREKRAAGAAQSREAAAVSEEDVAAIFAELQNDQGVAS